MRQSAHTYAVPKKSLAFGLSFFVSLAAVWSVGSMLTAGGVFAASREASMRAARIAVLLPQGTLGFAAVYVRAGAELAMADLAASAGASTKVELGYDSFSDAASGAQISAVVERLAAQKTAAIVGLANSLGGQDLLDAAAAKNLPVIALGAADDRLSIGPSSKWLLRLSASEDQDISALAFDALGQLPDETGNNLAVLASADAESSRAAAFLRLQLATNSRAEVTLYNQNQIAKLVRTRPDKVFVVSLETSLVMLPKLFASGLTGKQIELVPSNLADYSAEPWAKGMAGACGLLPDQSVSASLTERLGKRIGLPTSIAALHNAAMALAAKSYDAVKLVAATLQANQPSPQPLTGNALRRGLLSASMAASVGPKGNQISFDANGFQASPDYQRVCYDATGRYQNAGRYSLAASG
jgi:ABC-type branched-subunit amino acid transport system substrate-binding protein